MGTTYRFLEDPSEPSEVLAWFRKLPAPPMVVEGRDEGLWLYFRGEGALADGTDGTVDPKKSPLVSLFLPCVRRGVLWTVGEVHFLAAPLRQRFPGLHKISSAFKRWLSAHECVFSHKPGFHGEWDYYLEGSVRNFDPPVFALPSGLKALRQGQYFVDQSDNPAFLDRICKILRLRGIECTE